jgi:hypothetical protein
MRPQARGPFKGKRRHRHRPATIHLADNVAHRHAHVTEEHLGEPGVAGDLHNRADLDARGVQVHHEEGQPTVARRQ